MIVSVIELAEQRARLITKMTYSFMIVEFVRIPSLSICFELTWMWRAAKSVTNAINTADNSLKI